MDFSSSNDLAFHGVQAAETRDLEDSVHSTSRMDDEPSLRSGLLVRFDYIAASFVG